MSGNKLVGQFLSAFKKNGSSVAKGADVRKHHLVLLGKIFKIDDLSFDSSGVCVVSLTRAVLKLQMLRSGRLLLTVLIDLLPVSPQSTLLEALLMANMRLRAQGLSISLEQGSRMIVLQGELSPDMQIAAYKRRVEMIIATASEVKRNIEPMQNDGWGEERVARSVS